LQPQLITIIQADLKSCIPVLLPSSFCNIYTSPPARDAANPSVVVAGYIKVASKDRESNPDRTAPWRRGSNPKREPPSYWLAGRRVGSPDHLF
jgi:hypothetical protein